MLAVFYIFIYPKIHQTQLLMKVAKVDRVGTNTMSVFVPMNEMK